MNDNYTFVERVTIRTCIIAAVLGGIVVLSGNQNGNALHTLSGALILSASMIALAIVCNTRRH